jgi:hypothetical protein
MSYRPMYYYEPGRKVPPEEISPYYGFDGLGQSTSPSVNVMAAIGGTLVGALILGSGIIGFPLAKKDWQRGFFVMVGIVGASQVACSLMCPPMAEK